MTREALIKHWDVIQAFKDGMEIKVNYGDSFITDKNPAFNFYDKYIIVGKEVPTKRPPTIEEVEKWFMDNMVFVSDYNCLSRIDSIYKTDNTIYIDENWICIDELCATYTHYDGSELYITENEKQKLTYGGEIADFPIEIVERMLECQVEQGNKRDVSVFEREKKTTKHFNGFFWGETKEDLYFWEEVIANKNFDLFFQKYPKKQ